MLKTATAVLQKPVFSLSIIEFYGELENEFCLINISLFKKSTKMKQNFILCYLSYSDHHRLTPRGHLCSRPLAHVNGLQEWDSESQITVIIQINIIRRKLRKANASTINRNYSQSRRCTRLLIFVPRDVNTICIAWKFTRLKKRGKFIKVR